MTVLVVDASVLVVALADDGADGDRARQRLRGQRLAAPELIDLEVTSVLRKRMTDGHLDDRRARLCLSDLFELGLHRARHLPLVARCWQLRDNVTVYDASYVALAELLETTLLTANERLARAAGPRCAIEVLG